MLQIAPDYHNRKYLVEAAPAAAADSDVGTYWFDLRELFRILRRRRRTIIVTAVVLLALALLFCLIVTPRYTATSTVLIDPHRSSFIDNNTNQPVPANFASDDANVNSQALLIQSNTVLQRVVEQLNLAHDPEFG